MKRPDERWLRSRIVRALAAGVAVVGVGILGVVAVVGVVDGADQADSIPVNSPSGPESGEVFTASGVRLTDGAAVAANGFWPITVRPTTGNAVGVKCVVDGVNLGTDHSGPYVFGGTLPADGDHELRCRLLGSAGSGKRVDLHYTVGSEPQPIIGSGAGGPGPTGSAATAIQPAPSTVVASTRPAADEVVVADAASLHKALLDARPGMTITLKDGIYQGRDVRDPGGQEPGRFVMAASGTAAAPIILRGSPAAILDGGGTGGGYALHVKGASYWKLQGFTVRSAAKGIVLDGSDHNVIDGVQVTNIGDEGVHFRAFSSDNLLTNSTVDNTGVDSPNYGEGVYIGSARSNWTTYSGGVPDNSDRNQIINNSITDTAAEAIDIKEGSSNGVVRGNFLGGDKIASKNSADSWIDVKGNGYLVEANHGFTGPRPSTTDCGDPKAAPGSTENPFCDGIQVHVILDGWGRRNTFVNNVLDVNAPGAGIWLQNTAVPLQNVVRCDKLGERCGRRAIRHRPLPRAGLHTVSADPARLLPDGWPFRRQWTAIRR